MMKRTPEQELMGDPEQALAYAAADFEQPHSMFIDLFCDTFGAIADSPYALDLGCGPGDISFRFARACPQCHVHGVDGSEAMLVHAEKDLAGEIPLQGRVSFSMGLLPDLKLPRKSYDIIICNSLLHHLPEPAVLWQTVKAFAAPEALIFIMDLKRPSSIAEAERMRDVYAKEAPEVLRMDFYNSLLAAFEPDEIQAQLSREGLAGLSVCSVSDRHIVISGRMPG